jgi:S-DNA-T family DNA segregation ATPase FtsK/SpoIIIE
VLETPDAFHLPAIPGYGYLKVDTSIYRRFRAGYVSGPMPSAMSRALEVDERTDDALLLPVYNTIAQADSPADAPEQELTRPSIGRALIDECVDRLRGAAASTAPVWLEPLPSRLGLDLVIPPSKAAVANTPLSVPVGLLDDPSHQRRDPWLLDLTRSGGHVAILGAPQSGRSTFLRTVGASLALTRTPREVSIYGMDLTGGGLQRLEGFPHVGGVATRSHRDRLRRLLEELHGMLARREAVFRDKGIDSLQVMRAQHADGKLNEIGSADIVLLVDGLGAVRTDFDELEEPLGDLLQRGSSYGIHVVAAMTRWNELKMSLQPLIGTRLELRLNDPTDSLIGRKLAQTIRASQPGRLLTDESLFAQVALPVLGDTDDESIGEALEALAAQSAQSWNGPSAAPIRLLPDSFPPSDLPSAVDEPDGLPFGLRQDTLEPAILELPDLDQHLLVFGDTRSGKTTLMRGLADALIARYTEDELVIAVMDVRGELASGIPDEYLGGRAGNGRDARRLSAAIAEELERRVSSGVTDGPRVVVIADDYDILASGGTEPLGPLLPYLPNARDARLHVLVTRPVAGASRALFDVALQAIRDTGGATFIMSGERSEGQIVPQVYAEPMVPGRGRFVRRGERPRLVQVARFERPEPEEAPDAP